MKVPDNTLLDKPTEKKSLLPVPVDEINLILHWYKDEFILVKDAFYGDEILDAKIKFSDYPFVKNKMPIVSSNLMNLSVDQVALVHAGVMVKSGYIKILMIEKNGNETPMTFEEYNRVTGDEFVTANIQAKYNKPVLPDQEMKIECKFLGMRKIPYGRYVLRFRMEGENFFTVFATFVYPLSFNLIQK